MVSMFFNLHTKKVILHLIYWLKVSFKQLFVTKQLTIYVDHQFYWESVGFYLLGPFLGSLRQIFVDNGSTHQIWQHVAKGSSQAGALRLPKKTLQQKCMMSKGWSGFTHSQVLICVSVHTFSASVMPNKTGTLCNHKALKTLNGDLQAFVYSFMERLMLKPSLNQRTLLPNSKVSFCCGDIVQSNKEETCSDTKLIITPDCIWIHLSKRVRVSGNTLLLGFC